MNYKDYNDYELIYMVRENDDAYKDLLFKKYNPVISNIVGKFYNNYSKYGYEYEDFYQEAMIAFDRAVVSYNEDKNTLFYTYLSVCIKRYLLSFVRNISSKRKNFSFDSSISIDEVDIIDTKSDINTILEDSDIQSICKNLIYDFSLEIEETAMLELRLNGFTYREMAKLLDLPNSSIEFRFRRIKKKLKKDLYRYYCK